MNVVLQKPYYRTFSSYLKEKFGQKVYRVSLDAGFSCPTRNGTMGTKGCAYCSPEGSWRGDEKRLTLHEQVRRGKEFAIRRYNAKKFIAYFQAYTNTYAPAHKLKKIYDSVLDEDKDFIGLSVGTRPDCIDRKKLELLSSYREKGYEVWVEYGLQSAEDRTLQLINRGHTAADFKKAVILTSEYDINICAHIIIGLPGEGKIQVINTARFIAHLPVHGVKLHNLNIVRGTLMEKWFSEGRVKPLDMDEYAGLVVDFLEIVPPSFVVQRVVAESDSRSLIAPLWSLKKQDCINRIIKEFEKRGTWQGKYFGKS